MSIMTKISDFFGGSIFGGIKDMVMSYLPPDLSPTQRAEFEQKFQDGLFKKQQEANSFLLKTMAELNKRISEQEGTAKDLLALPVVGRLIIFLRGAQRPIWGYATLYIDWVWFSSDMSYSVTQEKALMIINILVLGFLFGERTIQNVMPSITKMFEAKSTTKT